MPRPAQHTITLSIDGREVQAPENMMLADAAKLGDIEIPVFCYERKLGNPVGACRMCLVEIEGMPKLQTACSTAVKDGMVVHTRSERARVAQQAVVEFLLINHPLDCPVCDKGGECPLQDITFGWGGGKSRFIEPKRHFRKPLELSPLVAIDRERCILCYRCVRFSQEISEDYQLVLLERGAHSFVGTFDGHPYVAPFSGNIIELCPVGALTSRPYRFRARPWDIEGAGSLCTLCPAQCNTTLTVRDDRVLRVLARDHNDVDDGWLCDKGRFAYQSFHVDERVTAPMIRDGGELRAVSWERALDEAAGALRRAGGRIGALAGGGATNEEGLLLSRLLRDVLHSPHIDSRPGGEVSLANWRALSDPALAASVADLEFAHAVLVLDCEPVDDAPILELRIRKGARRNNVRLLVASERPSALDPSAARSLRFTPGRGAELAWALAGALGGGDVDAAAKAAGASVAAVRALARGLREAGKEIVILYGERLLDGDAAGLLALAAALGLAGRDGAGLIGVPHAANGRGLREAGALPNAGPAFSRPPISGGVGAPAIAGKLAGGELAALYLLGVDPLLSYPDAPLWERALDRASTVVAHAAFLTVGIRSHATIVFPAEVSAEKEGTVTHPDGRVQRLRPAIGHAGEVRAEWRVLAELAGRLGGEVGVATAAQASAELFAAVGFYQGLTLEALAGRGVRWPETGAASALPAAGVRQAKPKLRRELAPKRHQLLLGSYRSIWAGPEVRFSPALHFLSPHQQVELSPKDAAALGLRHGEEAIVSDERGELRATVVLRQGAPAGTALLAQNLSSDGANLLTGPLVTLRPAKTVDEQAAALLGATELTRA
ncbi:MAG: NADH-quinone oxidoreductase subunit NuoG [Solirubrobacteraceae bacterium]|jgi:NADH-quinone oxidoreductase subunit G